MFLKIKVWLYIDFLKKWYGFGAISTRLIYAQAVHETGGFTSAVFKENNNLFGMRQAKVRKNYATGTNRGHAVFSSLFNSVRDYFERQRNFKIDSESDAGFMSTTIASNYAEDKNYYSKWIALAGGNVSPIIRYSGYVIWLVLAVLLWMLVDYLMKERNYNAGVNKFRSTAPKLKTV